MMRRLYLLFMFILDLEEATTISCQGAIREVCYCLLWTVTVTVIVGCFWDVRVIPSTN